MSYAAELAIVLIAFTGVAAWVWSRRRRDKNRSSASSSPRVTTEADKETSAAACKPVVSTVQTDEFMAPAPASAIAEGVLSPESSRLLPLYSTATTLPLEPTPEPLHLDAQFAGKLSAGRPDSELESPDPIRVATESAEKRAASNPAPLSKTVTPSTPLTAPQKENRSTVTSQRRTATSTTQLEPTTNTSMEQKKEGDPSAEASRYAEASEADLTLRAPTYRPLTAPAATTHSRSHRVAQDGLAPTSNSELRVRVQIVFGGGGVRRLALVPDRRSGMPPEVEVDGTQGELCLTELSDDCYVPIPLDDAANALLQGVDWRGHDGARKWRWVLGGRELYVLGPGDEFGLHGYISTARLRLNAHHIILATMHRKDEVLSALEAAGCGAADVSDDTTLGVPMGWLLFRDVVPTRPIAMRSERDLLNALCPTPEIEPHFIGGIRLERRIWLAGHPPRIRFTGELENGFEVKIDNQPAQRGSDGTFEIPGWDSAGEHRIWFGNRAETYCIRRMNEVWQRWRAHNFGGGPAVCGASIYHAESIRRAQIRIPCSNPLLLGARPGEVFSCPFRRDVRCENTYASVPFVPVWALPVDPAHADRQSARIMLYQSSEPHLDIPMYTGSRATNRRLRSWIAAIHDAGCKGLQLEPGNIQTKALWRRYRLAAKHLRRSIR